VTTRVSKKNPNTDTKKTQDEFNAVTSVLSSTHHGKHQGYHFTCTFAHLCKPLHIKTFAQECHSCLSVIL